MGVVGGRRSRELMAYVGRRKTLHSIFNAKLSLGHFYVANFSTLHMSYSLNSLKGDYVGCFIGDYYEGYEGGILEVSAIAHVQ